MRYEWIRGYEHMCARDENGHKQRSELRKEGFQLNLVAFPKHSKARKRTPFASVKRRRYPPHTSPTRPQLLFLLFRVFQQAVRRIGDNRVD